MPILKQCLGVDLGANTVKIVELAVERNSVRTIRAASAQTGVNPSMSDDEIRSAMVATARELIKKARFSAKKAVFSISGQKVFIRRFRLPKTSDERLARIIQYEARQQIPFPLDKTYLQFQHRDIPEDGEVEVLLVAIRTDEIRAFMQFASKVGLQAVGVGVSSFALYNGHRFISLEPKESEEVFEALYPKKKKAAAPKKGKKGAAPAVAEEVVEQGEESEFGDDFAIEEVKGFVNLGASSYDLAIGRRGTGMGTIGFSRTVPMGGDEMTRAIQKSLGIESFGDAERIKMSSTQLMTFNFDFEEEGEVNQEASMAVTQVADKMVTEIRRSLDFYITQPDGMAIDGIVLSGGQALLPGMDGYLEEKLSVPVTVLKEVPETSPLKWQESAGPITPYVIPVGLALQGLGLAQIKVDFLPEERKIIRDFPYKVTVVMILILLAIIGIASQAGQEFASKYRAQADSLQRQIQRDQQQSDLFNSTQAIHDETAKKYEELSKTFGQRNFWPSFQARLAELKPPDIVFQNMILEHNGRVTITGMSQQQVSAAHFIQILNRELEERLKALPNRDTKDAVLDDLAPIPNPPAPFTPPAWRFSIIFLLNDKQNHLRITPTPTPTPVGAPIGFRPGLGGRGGAF